MNLRPKSSKVDLEQRRLVSHKSVGYGWECWGGVREIIYEARLKPETREINFWESSVGGVWWGGKVVPSVCARKNIFGRASRGNTKWANFHPWRILRQSHIT
jgi:hypothetical protein